MSPNSVGTIGFVVFPVNETFDHSFLQVKLDISENFTRFRHSDVTVIVDGSTVSEKISDLTVLYSEKEMKDKLLYVCIIYQPSAHSLLVGLSKQGGPFKSADPFYILSTNLLKDEDEFMVGLKSYSGNFNLHSWSLRSIYLDRNLQHSYAALLESKRRWEEENARKRRKRMWEIVTCVVMTFGSTGLVFFAVMRIWAAFKRNSLVMVMPEECGIEAKREKVEVVMNKAEAKQERK
ncbi:hypothetical protein AALP_AA5G173900 [Arabis alpina]|uniref:Legume lectin domain-containing protein n=1 Tax=Arabis alpina TaxID=50452 RepID=A0A087GXQ1_ARAAL|nr:hypothetical protein AALP_AA5G173900 [Arabis alpina]